MARTANSIDEIKALVGEHLGQSEWHEVTQDRVNTFADATDDHQWIHIDPDPARTGPFAGPIAHGYLTLSLLTPLWGEILQIDGIAMMVSYGLNKVRFTAPVSVGSKSPPRRHPRRGQRCQRRHRRDGRLHRRNPGCIQTRTDSPAHLPLLRLSATADESPKDQEAGGLGGPHIALTSADRRSSASASTGRRGSDLWNGSALRMAHGDPDPTPASQVSW
ncbi:MAG: enoyl-CoA hydratase [Pseudonocardia sp.]|jgi:hypothetical protein|nr:enoyl-CoA hydratase [Pseudonocardia sp.]MDT7618149.1 hypothetical protein [Pseudonocardiales bacterium]